MAHIIKGGKHDGHRLGYRESIVGSKVWEVDCDPEKSELEVADWSQPIKDFTEADDNSLYCLTCGDDIWSEEAGIDMDWQVI